MEAGFWLKNWRRFFPKRQAKVIESEVLVRVVRKIQQKEEKRNARAN